MMIGTEGDDYYEGGDDCDFCDDDLGKGSHQT